MIKPECVVQKFHVGPEWCVVGMTRSLLHHPFTEAEELLAKPKTAEKSNQKESGPKGSTCFFLPRIGHCE